jgi:hypothetical protein
MLCRVGDDAFPFYYSDIAEQTWAAPVEKMLNTHGTLV